MSHSSKETANAINPGAEPFLEGCRMFDEYRAKIIASLPKGLSEDEFKRRLFERVYGAPLEDFLSGRINDSMVNHEACP